MSRALALAVALAALAPRAAAAQDATTDAVPQDATAPDSPPAAATAPDAPPPLPPPAAATAPAASVPAATAPAVAARAAPHTALPEVEAFPGPNATRMFQYGVEVRYGLGHHHDVDVDATSVQLELLFPTVADAFLSPHVGASWGNFGRPGGLPPAPHASRAWTIDFGLTLSWIVVSAESYVFHEQSWFNLELGVDLEAAVQTMHTASAAGGAVDAQSDFLLDLRPMARVVAMVDRTVSVYLGISLSWYDLTGKDDFLHGAEVSHRPSQLVLGLQWTAQGRTPLTAVPPS